MTRIYWGKDAEDVFGNLVLRDPEVMRAENEQAFRTIWEIVAAMKQLNERGER